MTTSGASTAVAANERPLRPSMPSNVTRLDECEIGSSGPAIERGGGNRDFDVFDGPRRRSGRRAPRRRRRKEEEEEEEEEDIDDEAR